MTEFINSNEDVVINEELNDDGIETIESQELTEEEKRELYIKELKESKIRFKPIKHIGNVTINQFGKKYKKERARKNRAVKKSRRANRK